MRSKHTSPGKPKIYDGDGDALMEAGDVSGALQVLSQAVSRDPNNVLGHTTLGHCHMRMGQYKSAVSCYNHAVNLDPTNPMTYNNRGVCKTLLKHNQLKDEMEREKKRLRKMSIIGGGSLSDDYDDFGSTAKTSRRRKKKKKRSTRKKSKGRKGRKKKKKNVWSDLDDIGLAKKYDTLVGLEDFNTSGISGEPGTWGLKTLDGKDNPIFRFNIPEGFCQIISKTFRDYI